MLTLGEDLNLGMMNLDLGDCEECADLGTWGMMTWGMMT